MPYEQNRSDHEYRQKHFLKHTLFFPRPLSVHLYSNP